MIPLVASMLRPAKGASISEKLIGLSFSSVAVMAVAKENAVLASALLVFNTSDATLGLNTAFAGSIIHPSGYSAAKSAALNGVVVSPSSAKVNEPTPVTVMVAPLERVMTSFCAPSPMLCRDTDSASTSA